MFMDMALLIESQGEMVDNIEKYMSSVGQHLTGATADLVKAREQQTKARKKKILIIIIAIVIAVLLIILLAVLLSKYVPITSSNNKSG
jgi:syntaxin 1B/2/3